MTKEEIAATRKLYEKVTNSHAEFLKAYADCPTQDNEGYVPDRGGFKSGFQAAWNLLNPTRTLVPQLLDEVERTANLEVDHREMRAALQKLIHQAAYAENKAWSNADRPMFEQLKEIASTTLAGLKIK